MGGWTNRRMAAWWRLAVCAAVLPSVQPPIRQSANPWPILDHASAAFQAAHTIAADFVQVITNPLVGEPDSDQAVHLVSQEHPSSTAMCLWAQDDATGWLLHGRSRRLGYV